MHDANAEVLDGEEHSDEEDLRPSFEKMKSKQATKQSVQSQNCHMFVMFSLHCCKSPYAMQNFFTAIASPLTHSLTHSLTHARTHARTTIASSLMNALTSGNSSLFYFDECSASKWVLICCFGDVFGKD